MIVFQDEPLFWVGVTKTVEGIQFGCEVIEVERDPVRLARFGRGLDTPASNPE